VWNPSEKEDEEFPERANKLIVKQILLGVEAKADEYNVVEVRDVYFNLQNVNS
jgi:Nucleoplasmin/nucleophosmin domain